MFSLFDGVGACAGCGVRLIALFAFFAELPTGYSAAQDEDQEYPNNPALAHSGVGNLSALGGGCMGAQSSFQKTDDARKLR